MAKLKCYLCEKVFDEKDLIYTKDPDELMCPMCGARDPGFEEVKAMRLIDGDRLIKVIEKAQFEGSGNIMSIINDAPTVEPTFGLFKDMLCAECDKRPHGEWKETRYETAIGITYRQTQCSNCGWEHELPMWLNFCPNCGADMRGEDK